MHERRAAHHRAERPRLPGKRAKRAVFAEHADRTDDADTWDRVSLHLDCRRARHRPRRRLPSRRRAHLRPGHVAAQLPPVVEPARPFRRSRWASSSTSSARAAPRRRGQADPTRTGRHHDGDALYERVHWWRLPPAAKRRPDADGEQDDEQDPTEREARRATPAIARLAVEAATHRAILALVVASRCTRRMRFHHRRPSRSRLPVAAHQRHGRASFRLPLLRWWPRASHSPAVTERPHDARQGIANQHGEDDAGRGGALLIHGSGPSNLQRAPRRRSAALRQPMVSRAGRSPALDRLGTAGDAAVRGLTNVPRTLAPVTTAGV